MIIYNKVLIEIHKIGSLKTQHNNLMKIYYSTEDLALREYIHNYCKGILKSEKYIQNKMMLAAQEAISDNIHNKVKLINYCEQMITCEKPEWQIIAERNGWVPPNH